MRIGIIGSGGAGTTAAYLLDRDHEVTLFERNAVLGGHAHTTEVEIEGKTYSCDDAFAWFSDKMYPLLLRMLDIHGLEAETVEMSCTFSNRQAGLTVPMPPRTATDIWRLLKNPRRIRSLLAFDSALRRGLDIVHGRRSEMTLGEFVAGLPLAERERTEFVEPFLFGIWGGPWDRGPEFAAYPVLKYPALHRPSLTRHRWLQVKGGAASYIAAVARSFERVEIRTEAEIVEVRRGETKRWCVREQGGESHEFDALILAAGANDCEKILAEADDIDEVRAVLERFEYYSARVATHRDPSFMPADRADWKTVHIDYDGHSARQSAWIGHRDQVDLFTSYIHEVEPKGMINLSNFRVPLVSPAHFEAQAELRPLQGHEQLYFAGDWTQDIGSHEDAVRSAVDVAKQLAPGSARLAELTGESSLARAS